MANQNYVTCKGKAFYPHLRTPEMFEGNDLGFTIKLIPSVEDAQKLEEFLRRELAKAATLPEFAGKKLNDAASLLGMGETPEGDTFFKFKTKSTYTTKSGDVLNRVIPIYDSKGKPLPKDTEVAIKSQLLPHHRHQRESHPHPHCQQQELHSHLPQHQNHRK